MRDLVDGAHSGLAYAVQRGRRLITAVQMPPVEIILTGIEAALHRESQGTPTNA
jgi:hypothetical protein